MLRVVIAARLSKKGKNGKQGIGIEVQDEEVRDWLEGLGFHVVETVADTKSGKVAPWDRPNLRPWVTDEEKMKTYDAIACYATDRLSRGDQSDFTRIEYWAVQNGKTLIIMSGTTGIYFPARKDPAYYDSDQYQWLATKNQAYKEWESIQRRTSGTHAKLREKGSVTGSIPFGYGITGEAYAKKVVVCDDGKKYVKPIFEHVAAGKSLAWVARWLDEEGAGDDRKWWPTSVREVIRNHAYHGRRNNGRGVMVDCPALVSYDLWEAANIKLNERKKRGPAGVVRPMLAGALRCDYCQARSVDSPMYLMRYPSGQSYYRCFQRGRYRKGCGLQVRAERADAAVDELLRGPLKAIELTEMRYIAGTTHAAEIDELQDQLDALPRRRLPRAEERAEQDRLWDEKDRLEAFDAASGEQGRWVEEPVLDLDGNPITLGSTWPTLGTAERGEFLRTNGITLYAGRDYLRVVTRETGPNGPIVPVEPVAARRSQAKFPASPQM